MDRGPGLHNKAEVIGYRKKYTPVEQQKEDPAETRDDEDANMADAPEAPEKQNKGAARDTEDNNGNNSGHSHNGNAQDNDGNDPISSLLLSSGDKDDPYAWESEPDRIYALEGEGAALSPPAHVLFAFGHIEPSKHLDLPERPDSKTVWFERMSAHQRQTLLSRKLRMYQIEEAFARMKDRIQMEALQTRGLPNTTRQGQAPMSLPLPVPVPYTPPGSSAHFLRCGIRFAMDPEPWAFGREIRRDEPEWVQQWRDEQQREQGKTDQKHQQQELQLKHRQQHLPQLNDVILPHLGPANPATTATDPGGLHFPTSKELLPSFALSGIDMAGTHQQNKMRAEGRVRPQESMLSLRRSPHSAFVRYAQFSRQEHLYPYQVPRPSGDDYIDKYAPFIQHSSTPLFASSSQKPSPKGDVRNPISVTERGGYLLGYRNDDNGVMQVDNGMEWAAANETKKKNTIQGKNQNKDEAGYSEACEKSSTLKVSAGREGHATVAASTDETGNGNKDTAASGSSQPKKNNTSSQLPGPGVINPSPPSSSGVNGDANMDIDVDVDVDKLAALKRSKMAPWEAMHSFLTIRRADYPSARAFLRACGRLRSRCRADWGMTLTRSFATAHMIRAMRSYAPALAGALRQAWRAGKISFEDVLDIVVRWDTTDDDDDDRSSLTRQKGHDYGMQMEIAGRTLEEWGRSDGVDDEDEDGYGYDDGSDVETVVGKRQGQGKPEQQGQQGQQQLCPAIDDEDKTKEKGEEKMQRYSKHELAGSRDIGALGLNDEQIQEFGFTQEGPDEFSYDV